MSVNININIIILSLLVLSIIFLVVLQFLHRKNDRNNALSTERTLAEYQSTISILQQQRKATLKISRGFSQAEDEKSIIELILAEIPKITGAIGASYIPIDERGHPLSATSTGDLPFSMPDAWLEYLASPVIRMQCNNCRNYGTTMIACPLLKDPFTSVKGMYCLPIRKKDAALGVLNIYLPGEVTLSQDTQDFLRSLIDETSIAVDAIRSRKHETRTIKESNSIRQLNSYKELIIELLISSKEILDVDFIILADQTSHTAKPYSDILLGDLISVGIKSNDEDIDYYRSLILQVMNTNDQIHNSTRSTKHFLPQASETLTVMALHTLEHHPVGAVLIGRAGVKLFTNSEKQVFKVFAAQFAQLMDTIHKLADMQYQVIANERSRLSREIHDGIAQNLGFLKLQTAQMQTFLDRGESDRVRHVLNVLYSVLSETYQDVREAIDSLRFLGNYKNDGTGIQLNLAIKSIIDDYEDNGMLSGINISLACSDDDAYLHPDIVAQVARIVQEALSNIRKHSGADKAWINMQIDHEELVMLIKDNGRGFDPQDIPDVSSHGLAGMHERAELIGADFQVISQPGKGTTISLHRKLRERDRLGI